MGKRILVKMTLLLTLFVALTGCVSFEMVNKQVIKANEDQILDIVITSDIHYLSDEINDHGQAFETFVSTGDGKQLRDVDAIMGAFVDELKLTKPDLLIISGDLTNNGERASHLALAGILKTIEAGGTSVYVIPGNHDINNPWARAFKEKRQYRTKTIDAKDFETIYADFGYDEASLRDEHSLSYLATPSEKLWLLMLDSNQYENNRSLGYPQGDGELTLDTLKWIESCLTLADEQGAQIIPVMHHNINDHSDFIRAGYTLNNTASLRELLKQSQINLLLSGHIHIQDISSYSDEDYTLYDIASNALVVFPHKYGMLQYDGKQKVLDYETAQIPVNKWIPPDEKDGGQVDFEAYSEKYFGKFAYDMAYKTLHKDKSLTDEEINLMAETLAVLNLRYFSGVEALNANDVVDSEGLDLWKKVEGSFLKAYILSIVEDEDSIDNQLKLNVNIK